MDEVQTSQMVVGIESIGTVGCRDAVFGNMHRSFIKLRSGHFSHAIAAAFESVSICYLLVFAIDAGKSVLVGDAIEKLHRGLGVDEVVTVIAVIPGSATDEYILFAVECSRVASEPVAITAFSVFRNGIEVIVGITIDEVVVCTFLDEIESDSHAVVSSDVLQLVMRSIEYSEVFALGMMGLCYLNTDALNVLDVEIAASKQESGDAGIRFYLREIEHGAFALGIRHADVADALLGCSALVEQEGYGIYLLIGGCHQVFLLYLVGSWHDINGISWSYEGLGLDKRGKGF